MLNEKDEQTRRETLHECFGRFAKQMLTIVHDTVGAKVYGELVDQCKTQRVHVEEIDGEEKFEEDWEETLPNEEIKEQIELEDMEGEGSEEEEAE